MDRPQTIALRPPGTTFMNFPLCRDLSGLDADFAILGIPFGAPYGDDMVPNDQAKAPAAVRRESTRLSLGLDHWDFDLDGTLFNGRDIRVRDCGDIAGDPADSAGHYAMAQDVVGRILKRAACPIIIGGDHGVPIPVLRAYDRKGPINIVQIDAHIDWRDDVDGVREGYSSPIRRASEMAHVDRIFQIGMRAQGSARKQEVEYALSYGADITTSYQVHKQGMAAVLARMPRNERYYLTIDADGLDPAVMPAVAAPAAGGLLFQHVRALIHGLVQIGDLVGMDIVEITPTRDINGVTALTAGQIILNFIGAKVRYSNPPDSGATL